MGSMKDIKGMAMLSKSTELLYLFQQISLPQRILENINTTVGK